MFVFLKHRFSQRVELDMYNRIKCSTGWLIGIFKMWYHWSISINSWNLKIIWTKKDKWGYLIDRGHLIEWNDKRWWEIMSATKFTLSLWYVSFILSFFLRQFKLCIAHILLGSFGLFSLKGKGISKWPGLLYVMFSHILHRNLKSSWEMGSSSVLSEKSDSRTLMMS